MAEWTYKLDIDMLERKGTSACLMATRAMIARIRELEAELERARLETRPGWKLVPVEPTDEMLDATRGKNCSPGTWNNWQKKRHATIYRQMVTAARASLDGRREG